MAKMTMTMLLSELKTRLVTGIADIKTKSVKEITKPFPTPLIFPGIYLAAITSPKERHSSTQFRHIHTVEIIPFIDYKTNQEASLIHASKGLIKLCSDIEDVLENNMLNDDSSIPQLNDCHVSIDEYSYEDREVSDNIFCRSALITYEATTKVYEKAVS
ncbi:hypothetical protein KAU34_10810 [candidate division WOR-3 bacterium]|nr:hypothetical protein [candidate division WOR-3 bacterium]